ncbi:uncharacterized protein LOC121254019 [Juglans microcarpa x Juglans regia]|uniref:uncharacterized protein LOC121254019 n=1 Tax=Juglans microcarpa x Juglans regia TaxID=2249226 RepID=UPI001B7E4BDF|nr:uncharacterized protein LOC121254019 [Juglans microcarpa x Juglans regia]
MDKSDDKDEPVAAMELSPGDSRSPVRRCVRRRLVQSTLFPQKPLEHEENGYQKGEKGCCDDEGGEDEEFCGSQSKKKRKPKGKSMPQLIAPKKMKEKRPVNTTPKKTLTNLKKCEDASPPMPDLRLEAKMSAKENSRMFAGKQMHPFFSSWKAGKSNQEVTEVEGSCCLFERRDKGITCGPIHIFETTQEDTTYIDWRNWAFCEDTFCNANHGLENKSLSVYEGSVECLHIDKLPIFIHPCNASTLQNEVSSDQRVSQQEHSPEVDHEWDKVGLFFRHMGCLRKSDTELQSRFLQERMISYYAGSDNQLEDGLWTSKYKPKKAMEVCGNDEAVRFLSDWLQLWRAKGSHTSKDETVSGQRGMENDDYYCSYKDSDSEDIDEEDTLKNVLLVTGPVGSGKSAAIYACAQEQGFEVLELSASECRNGALVKQRFGEALESHRLKRSLGHPVQSQNKPIVKSTLALPNGNASQDSETEAVEVVPLSDEEAPHDKIGASGNFMYKEDGTACDQVEVKPLILFEDVDIAFLEDRGFIAAIQQIAETAKGPMILTSNSNNPVLPDNLDRLQVYFTLPPSKEVLSHVYMVCATEGANIQPHLLERLVGSCHGDIRKVIMHLQFWCQGKAFKEDREVQRTYGSLLFDVEAGHKMLPKIIPWEFPSQLSELIDKEITKSLSMMEENPSLMEVVEEDKKEMQEDLDACDNETHSIETRKLEMLDRNGSVQDCNEFIAQFGGLSNPSGTPVNPSRQNFRRKLNVVLSSDSEDEYLSDGNPVVLDKDANNKGSQGVNSSYPSYHPFTENCSSPLTEKLFSRVKYLEETCHHRSERLDSIQNDETCQSFDVSCVPESTYVPESVIDDVTELLSRTVSCGHVANTLEFSVSSESIQTLLPVEAHNLDKPMRRLRKRSEMQGNNCDANPEFSHEVELEDYQDENVEATGHQVMDECSRMDFYRGSKFVEKPRLSMLTDLVQESWIKLRSSRTDLRQYVALEKEDAIESIELAYAMSNLISEVDLLLSDCQLLDSLEPSTVPPEGSDAFSWCDEQIQMTSSIAQHGFCFYAKDIAAVGSKMVSESSANLPSEMLASTTDMMALGKLIGQDMRTSRTLYVARDLKMILGPPKSDFSNSEMNSSLFNIIQSILPARSYLTVRDVRFYEYLSSLRLISRSEASRLSEGTEKTRRRRGRVARHYLSTGSMALSREDILLLGQYDDFLGKISTQRIDGN